MAEAHTKTQRVINLFGQRHFVGQAFQPDAFYPGLSKCVRLENLTYEGVLRYRKAALSNSDFPISILMCFFATLRLCVRCFFHSNRGESQLIQTTYHYSATLAAAFAVFGARFERRDYAAGDIR